MKKCNPKRLVDRLNRKKISMCELGKAGPVLVTFGALLAWTEFHNLGGNFELWPISQLFDLQSPWNLAKSCASILAIHFKILFVNTYYRFFFRIFSYQRFGTSAPWKKSRYENLDLCSSVAVMVDPVFIAAKCPYSHKQSSQKVSSI